MPDPILSLLGMARRAGCVERGANRAARALNAHKARLVCASQELSERTRRELTRLCQREQVPLRLLPYTVAELSAAVGTQAGTLTITDEHFAAGICRQCDETDKGGNQL